MADKERWPFRPLGLRMRAFGRRLMRHYVPPQSAPPFQSFAPPNWEADTQTPLIWDEPQPEAGAPPAENWAADIPPAEEVPPAAPQTRRRKPTAAPSPSAAAPAVQRKKADSENKIDPRLLAILAAHQERETRVAEIRERKTAASDLQRQTGESETDLPTGRRRNRASFDYVETKALLPPDDEIRQNMPPKTPPSDVIQPAREANEPEDDDGEESSPAGIIDFDVSQPAEQTSPADVNIPPAPQAVLQRTFETPAESPETPLPQLPDDEPETEPVYPVVYGLPEFPRVAEEPELFGEREITPPPAASDAEKPSSPVSRSTDAPAAPLQRQVAQNLPYGEAAPPEFFAPADDTPEMDAPAAPSEFFTPADDAPEPDAPAAPLQRQVAQNLPYGEAAPSEFFAPADDAPEPDAPPPVSRRKKPSAQTPPAQVNQPSREQPPRIQRQNAPAEMSEPTAETPDRESDEAQWPEVADDQAPLSAQRQSASFAAPDDFSRYIDPQAERGTAPEAEADAEFDAALYSEDYWTETEANEQAVPPVFDSSEAPASTSAPAERPVIRRKAQSPPPTSPVQPSDSSSEVYSEAAPDERYMDTEPIQRDRVTPEEQPTDERDWSEPGEAFTLSDFQSPAERPVIQRKAQSPPPASLVQPSDSGQGDQNDAASFSETPYDEAQFTESEFVQRELDDAPDQTDWNTPQNDLDIGTAEAGSFAPPQRPTIQRKTRLPQDFTSENLPRDHIPVEYPDIPEQIEPPFAGEWDGDDLLAENAADITPDMPRPFLSSPPDRIARQPDFTQSFDQPQQIDDAPEDGNQEQPVDVFQALTQAGMISLPEHLSPRIDRQAVPPEEADEDYPAEEAPYSSDQPADLYQALMNSGMIPPSPGTHQGEIARKFEPDQAADSPNAAPDRLPVQYAPQQVMRVETETNSSEAPPSNGEQSGGVDIDKLARDVYSALRDRLRVEKERRG